ncbi:hypothetical protein LVD13_07890 [Flavobacteriaceae bacterium D16]|nr:hypothetical protein [Flavobacteriaceae bacterium D16]
MKQLIVYILIALFAVISISACTNDEGGEDLDIITPNDTTQSKVNQRTL